MLAGNYFGVGASAFTGAYAEQNRGCTPKDNEQAYVAGFAQAMLGSQYFTWEQSVKEPKVAKFSAAVDCEGLVATRNAWP